MAVTLIVSNNRAYDGSAQSNGNVRVILLRTVYLSEGCSFEESSNLSFYSETMAADFTNDLCTPVFIVDLDTVKRNARVMLERFQKLGVHLRPHMKTHKTV